MGAAMAGGLLGAAVAGVMLLTTFRVDPAAAPAQRAVRLILRSFLAGLLVLGLTGVLLAVELDEPGSAVSLIGGSMLGIGAVGIRLAFGRFETGVHGPTPIELLRGRAIVEAAIGESAAVLGMVLILLDLFI